MKPLLVTSGEPAGVGPDLCLALVNHAYPMVILADKSLLTDRAAQLGLPLLLRDYEPGVPLVPAANTLTVLSHLCPDAVTAGALNPNNASYVMQMLATGAERCLSGEFAALITAPVHKAVMNEAGFAFTGHTEFFADLCQANRVVMMLACPGMKVALATTHLPLRFVPSAITQSLLIDVIRTLYIALKRDFGLPRPNICVAGLNPHAGESGYLGSEEIEVITPALEALRREGIDTSGPFPADTLFVGERARGCDVFLAMYHDQGLPVLKYAGFGQAVNVTLGLPIIRTSVDHGTALSLAGTGRAESSSLVAAVEMAIFMVKQREMYHAGH